MAVDLITGYPGGYESPKEILDDVSVVSRFIDTTVTPLSSAETYEILKVPAGSMLLGIEVTVHTAEGASDTIDVKDGSTTFVNDVSVNSKASTAGSNLPKYYEAEDTIDVLANAAITVAKFWVTIRFLKLRTSM